MARSIEVLALWPTRSLPCLRMPITEDETVVHWWLDQLLVGFRFQPLTSASFGFGFQDQ